jgi:hypothetical protein
MPLQDDIEGSAADVPAGPYARSPCSGSKAVLMRSMTFLLVTSGLLLTSVHGQECACEFHSGIVSASHSGTSQGQLYPFDQQDPWLHGQYQRVPSYSGYSSFRPYNYRHVAPQAHIAASSGATQGMSYSQQFFNRYRESYLRGNLHAQGANVPHSATTESTRQPRPSTVPSRLMSPASLPQTPEPRR